MSKLLKKKVKMESTESYEETFYEEDFEDFDYGDLMDVSCDRYEANQKKVLIVVPTKEMLVTSSVSHTSTAISVSPETDSAGNNLNTKGSDFADFELMSSLESDYNYDEEEEEGTAHSQSFDFRLLHEALEGVPIQKEKRFKNGTRSSLTFSNQRFREIERDNQLLLKKIMKHGPACDGFNNDKNNPKSNNQRPVVKSAAEVNRKKHQMKIDYENQLLKRKLSKIASRRSNSVA